MADDDSEPTWGDSVAGQPPPSPAAKPVPNQRSMPVVGRSAPSTPTVPPVPSAPPTTSQPHADYQRQAAQHFGTPAPPFTTPYPASYPAVPGMPQVPPPVSYPVVPPTTIPAVPQAAPYPPLTGSQPYPSYSQAPPRDSFITRLMERGVQGLLIRQPWFQDQRQRNPDPFVFVSFGIGVVVTIMLSLIPSSFVVTVLTIALWAGIGYLYFALGTKLAHQFVMFGICLVGGLVMLLRVIVAISALSSSRLYYVYVEPPVVLALVLLINLAGVAAVGYIGIQVNRGIQRMSQP